MAYNRKNTLVLIPLRNAKYHCRLLHVIFIVITAISLCLIGISCKGPSGPDGDDAFLIDSLPPQVEWLEPEPGVVSEDMLILSAKAKDERGVWRMVFYVGGFEQKGTLIDTTAGIYQYQWLAKLYPEGPYPLMARAWDAARNMATTPVVLVELVHSGEE